MSKAPNLKKEEITALINSYVYAFILLHKCYNNAEQHALVRIPLSKPIFCPLEISTDMGKLPGYLTHVTLDQVDMTYFDTQNDERVINYPMDFLTRETLMQILRQFTDLKAMMEQTY